MKKTYMKPALVVVNIEVTSMLCLSAGMGGTQDNGAALGRPGFFDIDEEEY